jgi:5-methylcytosine-specific restriction endonuclease McrA
VVAAGRPTCQFCGQPIDPDGHICPRSNGHKKLSSD